MMIKNLIVCISLVGSFIYTKAQTMDTLYNYNAIQESNNMYRCFIDTDYACFSKYMMPELENYVKEKLNKTVTDLTRQEMANIKDLTISNFKTNGVIQSIKTKTGFQKIIETFLEMKLEEDTITSISYMIGSSLDGITWKFMRLNNAPQLQLVTLFPNIDKRLKFPVNQTLFNKTIAEAEKTYVIQYSE